MLVSRRVRCSASRSQKHSSTRMLLTRGRSRSFGLRLLTCALTYPLDQRIRNRINRFQFLGTLPTPRIVTRLCPFMDSAAAGLPVHAGIFVVRLESDKAVYRLGEPIRLRVTVRNNTPRRYAVMWMQVWGLCDLTVLNSEGQSLSSTGNRGGFVSGAQTLPCSLPERLSLRIFWIFWIPSTETRLVSGRTLSIGDTTSIGPASIRLPPYQL